MRRSYARQLGSVQEARLSFEGRTMKQEVQKALRELAAKSKELAAVAERASAMVAEATRAPPDMIAKSIEPDDLAALFVGNVSLSYAAERGAAVFQVLALIGQRNGPEWSRELAQRVAERVGDVVDSECACGACSLCRAGAAAIAEAERIATHGRRKG